MDQNPKPTQKGIITAISQGIGTGKVKSLPESEGKELKAEKKMLVIDLRMRPTMYFAKLEEEEAAIEQEEGKGIYFRLFRNPKIHIQMGVQGRTSEVN